jgi:drug/metabolite transporter (DMT)-like permease
MTSKQKAGLLIILVGVYLLVLNFFPDLQQYLRNIISWPLILILFGSYLVFSKK